MLVDLVQVETSDGVRLDGAFRKPASGTPCGLPVDLFILHHGIGGAFYRPAFLGDMAEKLLEKGCAVILANNRGHDLAYNCPPPHGRLGAAFEIVDDCRLDWKAWLDFTAKKGFGRIGVWGHSLGAVKTIYYLAKEDDPRITLAVASSPPRFSYEAFMARPDGELFGNSVSRAQALADAGDHETLFPIVYPTPALMSTRSFFDKYGPDGRYNILEHLPAVNVPLLVTFGSLEGNRPDHADRFVMEGVADEVARIAADHANLTSAAIEGGDHFYAGCGEALWANVEHWLHGRR